MAFLNATLPATPFLSRGGFSLLLGETAPIFSTPERLKRGRVIEIRLAIGPRAEGIR